MNIKCIIFDLDGTLLDTIDDLTDCMNSILKQSNLPLNTKEDYISFVGNGIRKFVERSLPENLKNNIDIDHYLEIFKSHYTDECTKKTCIFSGIEPLLDYLNNENYKLCILSNKSDNLVQPIVSRLLSKWNFDVVSGAIARLPKKPDPTLTLEICNDLGIKPENCVFVGDSEFDVNTALNAGIFPIGVTWGYGKPKCQGNGLVVNSPEEIIKFLKDTSTDI